MLCSIAASIVVLFDSVLVKSETFVPCILLPLVLSNLSRRPHIASCGDFLRMYKKSPLARGLSSFGRIYLGKTLRQWCA